MAPEPKWFWPKSLTPTLAIADMKAILPSFSALEVMITPVPIKFRATAVSEME